MLRNVRSALWRLVLITALLAGICTSAYATVAPATVNVSLAPGASTTIEKHVGVPLVAPSIDVIFAFDLTGSMGGAL